MPATIYNYADTGAPVLTVSSSTDYSFIDVLKATLVTGYGSKSGAGWEVVNEAAGDLVLRQGASGSSPRRVVRVQATPAPSDRVYFSYEITTGEDWVNANVTGIMGKFRFHFTPIAGSSSPLTAYRSTNLPWYVVADARTVIFSAGYEYSLVAGSVNLETDAKQSFYIGDYESYFENNLNNQCCPNMGTAVSHLNRRCGAAHGLFTQAAYMAQDDTYADGAGILDLAPYYTHFGDAIGVGAGASCFLMPPSSWAGSYLEIDASGASVVNIKSLLAVNNSTSYTAKCPNKIFVQPIYLIQINSEKISELRSTTVLYKPNCSVVGRLKFVYGVLNYARDFVDGQTFLGADLYASRQFTILKVASTVITPAASTLIFSHYTRHDVTSEMLLYKNHVALAVSTDE